MFRLLLITLFIVPLVGCSQLDLALEKETKNKIYFSDGMTSIKFNRVKEFSLTTEQSWLLWGGTKLRSPNLSMVLNNVIQEHNGNGIVGLRIKTESSFGQGFVSFITLGIYSERNVIISGTVVSFETASLNNMNSLESLIVMNDLSTNFTSFRN